MQNKFLIIKYTIINYKHRLTFHSRFRTSNELRIPTNSIVNNSYYYSRTISYIIILNLIIPRCDNFSSTSPNFPQNFDHFHPPPP